MILKQQCTSLGLSIRLQELGVKQESLFCWTDRPDLEFLPTEIRNNDVCVAAFTASELFEMLPACIDIKKEEPFNFFWLYLQKKGSKNIKCILNYRCDTFGYGEFIQRTLMEHNIHDENLANALAKMLIHLIENKYIEIEKE